MLLEEKALEYITLKEKKTINSILDSCDSLNEKDNKKVIKVEEMEF